MKNNKIHFLGTGSLGTSRQCTSFVLNNHILFDIGYGIMTSLRAAKLEEKIDTIIISHFHPDHIADIVYFLIRHWEHSVAKKPRPHVQIIGPVGIRCVMLQYMNVAVSQDNMLEIQALISHMENIINAAIELEDNMAFQGDNFTVIAFPVIHGAATCNGYIIDTNGQRIGYTGDTCFCPAVENNIKSASAWIIDVAHVKERGSTRHISLERAIEIARNHPYKNFYTVHRLDYVEDGTVLPTPSNIHFPNDGDKFII